MTDTSDERTAVIAAVRSYFDAFAAGESTRPYAVERIATADALFAAARPAGVSHSVEIRELDVEEIRQDTAFASLFGSYIRRREDERTNETPLRGPVELHRENGTWRVVSFYRYEWPVAPILVDGREAKKGPIAVRARVVDFRYSGTSVLLEARNDSDEPARFVGVDVPSHRFAADDGGPIPPNRLRGAIPPRETVFREAEVPPLPTDRDRLELKAHIEHGRKKRRLKIRVIP